VRQTKIIATLGPASSTETDIERLIAAGVDVFRLNFSHGTHDSHRTAIDSIRRAASRSSRVVGILQDLSGPKIRTGRLRDGQPLTLGQGDALLIAAGSAVGEPGRISTTYAPLVGAVRPGDTLLLDDGRIQLRVEGSDGRELRTTVVDGGVLGEHKGINAPGVELPSGGLTVKDAADLAFGVAAGVDLIALSFVQTAADLHAARQALREAGAADIPLVAKLERPEAVARLDEIVLASDAVMVARGDLGLEVPLESVPRLQKEITRRARAAGVPVIVATQVLESMRVEPRPTRAEVSDAANAVDDRVDAIMLAGETAVGSYPVRAVQTLDSIIRDAERIPQAGSVPLDNGHLLPEHGPAICEAALTLAHRAGASAIVAVTRGGKTARVLAALRPHVPVFAATDRDAVARRLTLWWGAVPVLGDLSGDVDAAARRIGAQLVANGAIEPGAVIGVVSVTPDLAPGPSNFVKLHRV
jgi:pyruvate kinase